MGYCSMIPASEAKSSKRFETNRIASLLVAPTAGYRQDEPDPVNSVLLGVLNLKQLPCCRQAHDAEKRPYA